MKTVFLFLTFLTVQLFAQNQANPAEFLYDFLPGTYEAIGRLPESDSLYSATVQIKKADSVLTVIRKMDNREVTGSAKIEKAAAGDASVLRVRFLQDQKLYEITYLIHSDLGNYARLSGYSYRKDGTTRQPGLEVLFHKQ